MRRKKEVADRLAEVESRIDSDELITVSEREDIKERARAHVRKKAIERETDLLFNKEVRLAETEFAAPDEQLEEIVIDLPDFAYMITIDGVGYYHGCTYDVPRRKYLSMVDQMARTWEHEREIHGRRRKGDVVRDPFGKGVNAARDKQGRVGR
jgi:hypothetical protein